MEHHKRHVPEPHKGNSQEAENSVNLPSWFIPVGVVLLFIFPPLVVPFLFVVIPVLFFSSKKPIEITSYGKDGTSNVWELRPQNPVPEHSNSDNLTLESIQGIRNRHEESKKIIASYSMDIQKALQYPVFNDYTEPVNQEMLKALSYADDMYEVAQRTLDASTLKAYSEAVTALQYKIEIAKNHAEYSKWDALDSTTKSYFERAEGFYRHAFDATNPEGLRIECMNQLKNIIEKINEHTRRRAIPASVTHTVERALQKELE